MRLPWKGSPGDHGETSKELIDDLEWIDRKRTTADELFK
jgi:hypothetical protein